jgi:hypothetical protein
MNLVADVSIHHRIGKFTVDIFVPEWNMALEYQGGQHFQQTWHGDVREYSISFKLRLFLTLNSQQQRDREKQKFFDDSRISLIQIGHPWRGNWSQLRATIRQARPGSSVDLSSSYSNNRSVATKISTVKCRALFSLTFRSENVVNEFPECITLDEVTRVVQTQKFIKQKDCGSYYNFDYSNSSYPMMMYRKVFRDPNSASDESTKRSLRILRYRIFHSCNLQ